MSARKKKTAVVQPLFERIQGETKTYAIRQCFKHLCRRPDHLVLIKPKLTESKRSAWPQLIPDLDKVAALGEAISKQRPKTNKDWKDEADALDREGVCAREAECGLAT